MKDSELENCDDKKKELNYDAQVVDDLDYYVWDWVEKKPRLHEEIKSIPKLRKFILYLGQNKNARIYFSSAYKEIVLSFNFCSKSFIFTKSMWLLF